MLELIKSTVPEWEPTKFITDFEQATISAIKFVFPNVEHYGCYFHFKDTYKQKQKKATTQIWTNLLGCALCYHFCLNEILRKAGTMCLQRAKLLVRNQISHNSCLIFKTIRCRRKECDVVLAKDIELIMYRWVEWAI